MSRNPVLLAAVAAVAGVGGAAIAAGGLPRAGAVGVAAIALVLPISWRALASRVPYGALAVEVPVLLLVVSGSVLRQRTAQDLASNPLDSAGLFRVALVGLALLLGLIALLSSPYPSAHARGRVTTLPFRIYALYIVVVFIGAPFSLIPMLTAYRGLELTTGLLVIGAAYRITGDDATKRIEAALYWYLVASVAAVWIGVMVAPGQAIGHLSNTLTPIKWNVNGVFPAISANGVGGLGVTLAVWSLVRAQLRGARRRVFAYALALVGTGTLLAAQYRTGYVALVVTLSLYLAIRRKWFVTGALVTAIVGVLLFAPSVLAASQPYVLRGDSITQAGQLDSRLGWWKASIPVWKESPWVGRGLLTGTRYEVLARLGRGTTSTIHGTWIEALVGTGVIGLGLLGMSLLTAGRRALREAFRRGGQMLPILLLAITVVGSFTGPTIEVSGGFSYLWIAMSLKDPRRHLPATPAT